MLNDIKFDKIKEEEDELNTDRNKDKDKQL